MAIYSLEVSVYSRSRSESMIAKAAYRSGAQLLDRRTGRLADYRRRSGVEADFMVFPHGLSLTREEVWNAVEHREIRRDACVGRQILFALPSELSPMGRERCARAMAQYIVDEHGTFVDCAIHQPGREGDRRNFHVHALLPTRRMDDTGVLTTKLRHWDDPKQGPKTIAAVRATWAEIANQELAREGHTDRIDHRSNKELGIEAKPSVKLGLVATSIERRSGAPSQKRLHIEAPIEIDPTLVAAVKAYEIEVAARKGGRSVTAVPPPAVAAIKAVLLRLRKTAQRQIRRHLAARATRSRGVRTIDSRPMIMAVLPCQSRNLPLSTDKGGRRRSPHVAMLPQPPLSPANPSLPSAEHLEKERLRADEWSRIWAFALAAMDATAEGSAIEIATFVRWAIKVAAAELGLSPAKIEAGIRSYKSLTKPEFSQLLDAVGEQCQRLINAISDRIATAKLGYRIAFRPPSVISARELADGRKILTVLDAERLVHRAKLQSDRAASAPDTSTQQGRDERAVETQTLTPSARTTAKTADQKSASAKSRDPVAPEMTSHSQKPLHGIARFETRRPHGCEEAIEFSFPEQIARAPQEKGRIGEIRKKSRDRTKMPGAKLPLPACYETKVPFLQKPEVSDPKDVGKQTMGLKPEKFARGAEVFSDVPSSAEAAAVPEARAATGSAETGGARLSRETKATPPRPKSNPPRKPGEWERR